MTYRWNYGNGVLNLPAAALDADASAEQLQILLLLAKSGDATAQSLAKDAHCSVRKAEEALSFWMKTGILVSEGEAKAEQISKEKVPDTQKPEQEKKLARADEIPTYSVSELNDIMDRRQSLRAMVNEAQQILGKMFNTYDINVLLGMVDYLELDEDYILLLLAHCSRIGIKGLRSIERYAISLIDRGITTASALEEQVQIIEAQHTPEGKVRSIFGMKSRSLTEKERKMIGAWAGFGYGEDVIRRAYEITVDTIHEPSMQYTTAILDRWHTEGLKTLAEIDRKLEAERAAKGAERSTDSDFKTFDADAAFEAALKRSFKKSGKSTDGKD